MRTLGTLLLSWNLLLFFGNGLCVFVLDMFSMLLVLFVIIAYLVLLYLLLPLPLLILQLSMGRCVCSPRRQTSTLTTPYMLTCNSLGKPLPANSDIFFIFSKQGVGPPPYFGNYLAFYSQKFRIIPKKYYDSDNHYND